MLKKQQLKQTIERDYSNIAALMIQRDHEIVFEQSFNNFTTATPLHVFSVTKSIISLLYGIALDKKYLTNLDQKILDFFPAYKLKRGEKTLPKITIRDMLIMSVPYKYKYAPYTKYFSSEDWTKTALDLLGGKGTIGEFRYAGLIGPDILSAILTKVTGQSVLEFARDNVFKPLGINVEKNITFATKEEQLAWYKATDINGWVADSKGVNTAGWGLTLSCQDLLKIGQLYLNGGEYNNQQIVSKKWIDKSTQQYSLWSEMNLGYGYLWWIIDKDSYAAIGDGGNLIYINTSKKLIVSILALFNPRADDPLKLIKEYVEPAF